MSYLIARYVFRKAKFCIIKENIVVSLNLNANCAFLPSTYNTVKNSIICACVPKV